MVKVASPHLSAEHYGRICYEPNSHLATGTVVYFFLYRAHFLI